MVVPLALQLCALKEMHLLSCDVQAHFWGNLIICITRSRALLQWHLEAMVRDEVTY